MQFYGKAESVANTILELFKIPSSLPNVLAPIFVHRKDNVPCRSWSWSNQLLTALAGTSDARGFRQWQQVGRYVRKGSHAFSILAPCSRKIRERDSETGEQKEQVVIYGFRSVPVFRYEDTEGPELPGEDGRVRRFLDSLPLIEVARHWSLHVDAYNGRHGAALGWYRHGEAIALGVENPATWAHELVHGADDRLGKLKGSTKVDREVVAELGGAVLLECVGKPHDADLGGCWQYIKSWCENGKLHPVTACERLLRRVCDCVALILDTADKLASATSPASTATPSNGKAVA